MSQKPHTFAYMYRLLDMVHEFFGHTCIPDSRVEFCTGRELNLLKTLLVVDVKCILYLISVSWSFSSDGNSSLKNDFKGFSWKHS
jgi:hypothetical protein